MDTIVQTLNTAGRAFVHFALPMLLQSSLLILLLLVVDAVLRRRVRAVFRYWIWMLVLVKLVLPPSLWSPVSIGTWVGDELEVSTAALLEPEPAPPAPAPSAARSSPAAYILSAPDPMFVTSAEPLPEDGGRSSPWRADDEPGRADAQPSTVRQPLPAAEPSHIALTWQGLLLLAWAATVMSLLLLLLQRAYFVRGLVAQAEQADQRMLGVLEECRAHLGLRRRVALRLSPNATSPAVCGLRRPTILIPQNLAPRLQGRDLRAVFLHELAHIRRGDLWVNLAQTLLQIAYFYHPLLWLANAVMRRAREQAVDETVLVALGETAAQYPETLVNVAKLAFRRRPVLSLRLVGVVESKSALSARIRHILSRPLPRTARLGLLGLLAIFVIAAVLLPMAGAAEEGASVVSDGPLDIRLIAVCPDGGDEFYDPDGRRLDYASAPLGGSGGPWDENEQHRDFVLQMPHVDGQLLFPTTWLRAAGTDRLLGGGSVLFSPGDGPSTLVVSAEFDRTYREVISRAFAREVPVRKVDLPLQYFYGARREAICTFTGPFRIGQVVQAEEGRSYQLTPEPVTAPTESQIKFRFTTSQPLDRATPVPVLLYDIQGRRHLVRNGAGGMSSPQGADLTYDARVIPWDQIAAVTVGEKPYTVTFRNIVVQYPDRPPRTYPPDWDRMAERLGLTELSWQQLAQYKLQNVQQVVAVLDVVRSYDAMSAIMRAIEFGRPPVAFTALDEASRATVRQVAARWLQSPEAGVRAYGVELGLMAGLPEFVDPAFALLDYQHPLDVRQGRDVRYPVSAGLRQYRDNMTAADIERLKQRGLRGDDPGIWSLFVDCLRAARRPAFSDVAWELAQDERPWVWGPCLQALREREDKRLRAYSGLSEKMKLHLFLASDMPVPGDETLAAQAKALVPGLFTLETVRMYPADYRAVVARHLTREEATAVYMGFLRELSRPGERWRFEREHNEPTFLYSLVPALVRDINLWYGVNLGGLGVYEYGNPNHDSPATFLASELGQIITDTLSWYEGGPKQPPRAPVFAGRVVDTAGQGLPGVTLTLKRPAPVVEESGQGNPPDIEVGTLQTDVEGRFEFRGLTNTGLHWLHITAPGFSQRDSLAVSQLPDGRFYLQQSPRDNVIVMERPAGLAGRLIGHDGRPLANAVLSVSAYPAHDVPSHGGCPVDGQGRFAVDPVTSGYYLVRYDQRDQQSTTGDYDGTTAYCLVEVREGQAVDDVVLDLRQSTACLEFEIVDDKGQPLGAENVGLNVDIPSRNPPFTWVMFLRNLKPQSIYRLPNLPPLEGHLDVTVTGQPPRQIPVKLAANETTHCKVGFAESAARAKEPVLDVTALRDRYSMRTDAMPIEPLEGSASADSDGDELSDFQEVHKYLTDPTKMDSDGDGTPDGDWNERREYTYSVRTVMRYLPPFDERGLNDDFQDARVLKQTDEYIETEVIHYPLATGYDSVPENPNWRRDNARDVRLAEYLAPGATTNWDEQMRKDLLAALQADGIDVETLTDKQVVERVSSWLLKRSRYLDSVFTTYYVDFPQGKPRVYPGLEDAFRHEFERDSRSYDWPLEQHFDHELLGKGMFYNKTHGSCTSTAVYLTTVLRALGLPTRMVLATPVVDASDRAQVLMVKDAITNNRVRLTMLAGLGGSSHGWTNHTFNEVYVGGRWCRLDGGQLGCPAFGPSRFGLQTHLYTFNDLSDVNFAPTWGRRYAKGEHSDAFQHDNPYSAVEVSELFGPHGNIPNPPFTAQDFRSYTEPDIFLFYPSRVSVWDEFIDLVGRATANKTGRPHQKEFYDNLFDGIWLTRPQDILVLLFSLDTPERVPAGYEDLLPKPWAEIESALQRGETVELSSRARDLNIILLAAPTGDGLKALVLNSRLLRALGGAGPAPTVAATSSGTSSAAAAAKLPDGVMVELLGVCEYPSDGKRWWRPDGAALNPAPYQTTNNKRELKEGFRDYELVVRYRGAPEMDIQWDVPGSASTGTTGNPYGADGKSIPDLTVCTVRFPQTQTATHLRVGTAAGVWETQATHASLEREGTYTLQDGKAVAFGIPYTKDGDTFVPVTTNFFPKDMAFRVVAMQGQNEAHSGGMSGFGDKLNSLTYRFKCPLREIRELRFQTRPWTWVEFRNVALRPGFKMEAQAAVLSGAQASRPGRRPPGEEKVFGLGPAWEVLKAAVGDHYGGAIGGFGSDATQRKQYFDEIFSLTHSGDIFVLMFAFDQPAGVPPEYLDLLPLPWAQIESRVRAGESVEAHGQARDLTVLILAAPTSARLDNLSRQTALLHAFRSNGSAESKGPAGNQGVTGAARAQPEASPAVAVANPTPVNARLSGGGVSPEKTRPEQVPSGPPVERVLSLGEHQYLDLDAGRYVTVTPAEANDPPRLMSRGIDLYFAVEPVGVYRSPLPQVQSLQLELGFAPHHPPLQEISVDSVREALGAAVRQLDRPKEVTAYASDRTFSFRTAEGTAGVLRVTWPRSMDVPRCTIQYRLLPELDLPSAEFPWGAATEGRQCRLRAPKRAWRAGETVTLSLDIRNQGAQALSFLRIAEAQCELEVDGAWYGWAEPFMIDAPVWPLEPQTELDDAMEIRLTNAWALPAEGLPLKFAPGRAPLWGRRLELTPGRHTVRVRFYAGVNQFSPAAQDLSLVSNPVDIVVLSSEESLSENAPVRPTGEAAGRATDGGVKKAFSVYGTVTDLSASAGAEPEKRIVLPDVDRQPVMLDLATGELVAIPKTASPSDLGPAIEKLGRGDLVYDSGVLVLVRGAGSAQAQEGPVKPFRNYRIGAHLPEVLTVTTTERRRYEVRILSVDDDACTLTYSLTPGDKAAGRGAMPFSPAQSVEVKLANGVTGTLLGLFSGRDVNDVQCWYPDGTPVPAKECAEFMKGLTTTLTVTNVLDRYDFGYLLQVSAPKGTTVRSVAGMKSPVAVIGGGSLAYPCIYFVSRDRAQDQPLLPAGDIQVVAATGPYKNLQAEYRPQEDLTRLQDGDYRFTVSTLSPATPKHLGTVAVIIERDDVDVALRLQDAQGDVQPATALLPFADEGPGPLRTFRFMSPLWPESVKRILLDYRVASTGVFRNVSLRPGHETNVVAEARRTTAKQPVAAEPGPIGRHALSFDGVDDKLVVPASASLTLKPPFFIEVWAKPDFSMLPQRSPGRIPDDGPWPEMSLIRQGDELQRADSPSRAPGGSDTEGWPVPRPPSVHGLNNVQSGGFMGFLRGYSGALFAVRQDGRVRQRNIFRASGVPSNHPGWLHDYSSCVPDGLPEDYVPAAAPLVIGGRIVPNGFAFKGEIVEVRLWNKVLTTEEMQRYEVVSLTGNEPNLVACWDFERQPGGQVVYDITPNHNDARLGNVAGIDDADPRWVSLDADQSLGTTSATEYVRRYLEDWKTTVRNNYLLKDFEIVHEYVLEGSTGAVAYVWIRSTLVTSDSGATRSHEGVIFLYRLNTDRWEGIFNFDGALSHAKDPEAVERLITHYRQGTCPRYLEMIEQGYVSVGGPRRPGWSDGGVPAQTAQGNANRQAEGASLSGVVVDDAGRPLEGVRVSNWYPHGSMPQETTTDARGRFSFKDKRGYVVKAERAGLAPEFSEFKDRYFGEWQNKSIHVALTMTEGGVVAGLILSQDNRTPIPGAQVWLELEAKDTDVGINRYVLWRTDVQRTDDKGHFEFRRVPDGMLRVGADANGFVEGATEYFYLDDKGSKQADLALRPKTAEELQQDRILAEARRDLSLSGTVTDEAGRPVDAVEISNWFPGGSNPQRTYTDANGRYHFAEHRGYVIAAKKPGFAPVFHEFRDEYHTKYRLPGNWRTGSDRRGPIVVDLILTRGATLSGTVLSIREGTPAAGVRVHLEREAKDPRVGLGKYMIWTSDTIGTDSRGRFVFESVPAGITHVFANNVPKEQLLIEGTTDRQIELRLDPGDLPERRPAGTQTEAAPGNKPSEQTQDVLRRLIDEAQPGGVVTVPRGRYATPVEITKPVVLRGESQDGCIIEVTADQPAVLINAGGRGDVTVENLTIQWQLATDKRIERPAALLVKDTTARIHNCRFVPLGDPQRSPTAVYIEGRSKSIVDNCRFNGFEYTICQGPGTEGVVMGCLITDCGHQGVIAYDGATLTVLRCVVTGSKFHAIRCTGGTLHLRDNLLINNANRGIYLGNKTGRGTITNNVILGNGSGISGFAGAEYAITNNVIMRNSYAGIDMRGSCRLEICNNVLIDNQRGVKLHKEGAGNSNVLAGNIYWSNATDVEDIEDREGTVKADPQFADPNHGDFTVRRGELERHGLTDPQVIKDLWRKYEQAQRERPAEAARQTRALQQGPSRPAPPVETVGDGPATPAQDTLKRLMDEARPGAVVTVPKGRHTLPVEITKPVVLRGESLEGCIIEVTADQPALLINTGGLGDVTVENLTIQWQLATDKRIERPTALWVKDTNARIRNCCFEPLGDARRSATAIFIEGRSNSTVDNCRFRGFEYTICYGPNTQGVVQDCIIADCGHQGVINYDGSALTVQRCLITGSKFHAVRCTGGTLNVKDNLLIKNANRGIYLGNKTGRGTITNNVILGNGSGISGFGRASYVIANNVVMDNQYAGIDMRDSCRLSIHDNVLAKNQRGLVLFKEGTENFNTVGKNAYWANATDVENMDKPQGSLTTDPQFADPNRGDFTVRGPARDEGQGLTNPEVIKQLWAKYEQLQRERPAQPAARTESTSASSQAPSAGAGTSTPSPAPAPGPGPIQQRIDAAAPGAIIRLEPGVYRESLRIDKPLTLEGAGWDKTVIVKDRMAVTSLEDIERLMAQRMAAAQTDAQRQEIAAQMKNELAEKLSPLALTVENAQDVVIRGLKFTSPGAPIKGGSINVPLLKFDHSRVRLSDCVIIGAPGPGVHIVNGSGAEIERTLVAAVWGTGIVVGPGPSESGVRIHDCDIRNCHYAGVGIGKNASDTRVERCRIWGAAWHGIRYDNAAPQILGNLLYGHARFGIYASGQTAATVRNNLFFANEMTGMAGWFQSNDRIEGNTFANNKEANLAILGASKPDIRRNIFYGSPVGISLGNINENSPFAKSEGTVALQDNLFWLTDRELQWRRDASTTEILAVGEDTGTLRVDPGFTAAASRDFSLRADSPARVEGIGAGDLLPFDSPWPLQPEELAIIPKGDTRDYRQWRQPN